MTSGIFFKIFWNAYEKSSWMGVDQILGIDPEAVMAKEKYTDILVEMIAERENWDRTKITCGPLAHDFTWQVQNGKSYYTFERLVSYDGIEKICIVFVQETFAGQFAVEGYEFTELGEDGTWYY